MSSSAASSNSPTKKHKKKKLVVHHASFEKRDFAAKASPVKWRKPSKSVANTVSPTKLSNPNPHLWEGEMPAAPTGYFDSHLI